MLFLVPKLRYLVDRASYLARGFQQLDAYVLYTHATRRTSEVLDAAQQTAVS